MQIRIALIDDYQHVAAGCAEWHRLPAFAALETFHAAFADQDAAAAALARFDVIVAMRERTAFPESLLARLPQLKLLVSTGPRNAAIDTDACARHGIALASTRADVSGLAATAELTWALILAVAKRLPQEHLALLAGSWQTGMTQLVCGKTLGIAGLGRIGGRVARIGTAFGMDVVAWSPHLTRERAAAAGVALVSKQQLFERADVLSLHLALGEETRGIVAAADIGRMKRDAILVNTARAALIAPGALVAALQRRAIGGAGLDVYDHEPLPLDDPLRALDQVVLTPHLGYVTDDNYRAIYGGALQAILGWIDRRADAS